MTSCGEEDRRVHAAGISRNQARFCVEHDEEEGQRRDQEDGGEAVDETKPVRIGVVVDAGDVDPADHDKKQEQHETCPPRPGRLLDQGSKTHLMDYTEPPG